MSKYKIFKDMSTKFIIDKGADLIYDSAKEAKENDKNFIRTLGDNAINTAISDVAAGLLGGEATLLLKAVPYVMKGIDKTFEYGRNKANHQNLSISSGKLGNGYFISDIGASMRQRQINGMASSLQAARDVAFGSEARKRAMNISY